MASPNRVANQYIRTVLVSRVASAWLAGLKLAEDSGAGSAALQFFDSPERREVREFAESNAISNIPEVALDASRDENAYQSPQVAVRDAEKAPPTPEEIDEMPGGEAVSTLNRFLVQTEEPVPPSVPQSRAEVTKHPEDIL